MITTKNDSVRLYGLSTDDKPVDGIINGTIFVEIDTSDEYYFNEAAGTWVKKNSSVGGGLPTPTMADNGKAVVVSATVTEGAVIVPEQSITSDGSTPAAVTDGDASAFVVGTEVIATIDDVTYMGTIVDNGGMVGVELADGAYFFAVNEGAVYYGSLEAGTYTVKLSARGADSIGYGLNFAGMAVTPSNGFLVDDETGAVYFSEGTVLNKTFAEIAEAAKAGCSVNLVAVPADGAPDVDVGAVFRLSGFNGGLDWYAVYFEQIYLGYDDATHYVSLPFSSETADGVLTYATD